MKHFFARFAAPGLLVWACQSGADAPSPAPIAGPPTEQAKPLAVQHPRPSSVRASVYDAAQLGDLELSRLEQLDLALSAPDRVGFLDERAADDGCTGLDLVRLAAAAPNLVSLRISGCEHAVQSGLAAFSDRLVQLDLADMNLDPVTVDRLGQLRALRRLGLRRMKVDTETFASLRPLNLEALRLSELSRDSDLALLLALWPHSLRSAVLEGNWAGHKAMLSLAKASALQRLELRQTRIGSFSLSQLKALTSLHEIVFAGPTFTDSSPTRLRGLPLERFSCDCPRLGDRGLRALRHNTGLRTLKLGDTQVTGAGLLAVRDLEDLETLELIGVDLGPQGFEALSTLPRLRRLRLSGTLKHPRLENLSMLTTLEVLALGYPDLDDRAAPELANLTGLRELDLSRTQVSDLGLGALSGLANLEVLRLHHTRVTNRGLGALQNLARLRVLELDHTDVVDAGVEHLAQLRSLVELRLDATLVTDAGLEHLTALQNLERLNLAHTVVTAAGTAKLAGLPRLTTLGLQGIRIE